MNATAPLEMALALLRQGQADRAEQLCRSLLRTQPDDFGASHLLGILLLQRDPQLAERQLAHAIGLDARVPAVHYNHGNALAAIGRHADALDSFDRALSLKPDFVEALYNRGNAQAALGRTEEAAASYRAAVTLRPGLVDGHNNLGHALLELGRPGEALASFDTAIALDLGHAGAHNNRGSALLALERGREALASYDQALALRPGFARAHANRGIALQALGRPEEAIAAFSRALELAPHLADAWRGRADAQRQAGRHDLALRDIEQALALQPGDAAAFNVRGIIHHDRNHHETALSDYERAVAADPRLADAHVNRGNALYDLGRPEEALRALDTALALQPGHAEALVNRGMVLQDLRRFAEALADYDAAITSRPAYAEAYKRRAMLHLLQGDFAPGWKDYEASALHGGHRRAGAVAGIPTWEGGPLSGKRIVVTTPGAYGDAIHFFRYVPKLVEAGADVTVVCTPRLAGLLRGGAPEVRFVESPAPGDRFDLRCDLWSLPHVFGTTLATIPAQVPYLVPDAEAVAHWKAWLGDGHCNVGIAWQGKPDRKIDAGRSIPLAEFAPLARIPGVRLVSLQRGHGIEQLTRLPDGMTVLQAGEDFDAGPDAFRDTAALIQSLDLVVTSDTAIAHLAGALGRPAWVVLKRTPEWRWLLDRDDSPWYPTLRLFRQSKAGEWGPVFEVMAATLHP